MRRVIKADLNSDTGIEVGSQAVRIAGNLNNLIHIDSGGVSIVGPVSFLAQPEDIRIGGQWVFPTGYEGQLPSSIVNPQPMFIAHSPVAGFQDIADQVAELLGELI